VEDHCTAESFHFVIWEDLFLPLAIFIQRYGVKHPDCMGWTMPSSPCPVSPSETLCWEQWAGDQVVWWGRQDRSVL